MPTKPRPEPVKQSYQLKPHVKGYVSASLRLAPGETVELTAAQAAPHASVLDEIPMAKGKTARRSPEGDA